MRCALRDRERLGFSLRMGVDRDFDDEVGLEASHAIVPPRGPPQPASSTWPRLAHPTTVGCPAVLQLARRI